MLLDMSYPRQGAYDQVDVSAPLGRQREVFTLIYGFMQGDFPFNDKEEAQRFFAQLTGLLKNLNDAPRDSPDYTGYLPQIDDLVKTLGRTATLETAAGKEG